MSDDMNPRQAEALVNIATEEDRITCSDCGVQVNLESATTVPEVLIELERHRQDHD